MGKPPMDAPNGLHAGWWLQRKTIQTVPLKITEIVSDVLHLLANVPWAGKLRMLI